MSHDLELSTDARWRLRFWTVLSGQGLSLIGSSLTQFVLLWWITDTTGSVAALATAGMAALLPQALLGPVGGVFADRYSRRWLMVSADAISALCMVVLIWLFLTERFELWHAYVMMAIRSAMQAFQEPAALASVPMLVPKRFLVRAAGMQQVLDSLTLIAAAPLGALAISLMPIGWALAIDVITAVIGIVPLLLFRIPQSKTSEERKKGLMDEFTEGVAYVWQTPGLRQIHIVVGAVSLAIMPTLTLIPLLVKEHFGGGASDLALMEGLSGAGMLLGGVLVVAMAPRKQVQWILCGFALSCLAMALAALVPSQLFGVAVAWWVISSIAFVFGEASLSVLTQTKVPNNIQGRVLSLMNTILGLAAPVGLMILGPLGEILGVRWLFVIAGLLGAVASISGFLSSKIRIMNRSTENNDASRKSIKQ